MAVAPVAVEIGPRNSHSANQSGESAKPSVIVLIPQRPGLAYGMTKHQILHRLGKPEKVAGQCWQYPENIKDFGGGTINAVRLCFWAGQYQSWFMERNGMWQNVVSGTGVAIPPPTRP